MSTPGQRDRGPMSAVNEDQKLLPGTATARAVSSGLARLGARCCVDGSVAPSQLLPPPVRGLLSQSVVSLGQLRVEAAFRTCWFLIRAAWA